MFNQIKGHSIQIKNLIADVNLGKLSSGYLFGGPSGIGKKLVALNFAKFISCENISGERQDSCGGCPTCKKIDNGQHPDIFLVTADSAKEIDTMVSSKKEASSAIKIEQIKEIGKRSSFRPYEAKYKIFIIDEAEKMTQEASDALLKTLEEPPKDTIFILVSASERMLAATIVSRCRRIKFNALSLEEMKEMLIADYRLDETKAHFLSCFSQGRLANVLKIKDKDILTEKNSLIDDFLRKKIFFKDRFDAQYKLNLFLGWLRDLLLSRLMKRPTLINIDREAELLKNKNKYTISELKSYINFISEALLYLERNINLRLLTNLARIKLCKA
ncbi:MAG: DNA polymerase III subunit delta' [Candidatus Omnitrophota bacterium]